MKQEEIDKAFEGRWRLKDKTLAELKNWYIGGNPVDMMEQIKRLCRDFFEAGTALSEPKSDTITVTDAAERFCKEDFEYWWSVYDKKRGKDKCIQKWMKLSVNERKACIVATPAYVASTPDKAYRKDPLTYLNGKCWNDEIIMKNNGNKPNDNISKLGEILAP